jgi:pleiotropic regulator 1
MMRKMRDEYAALVARPAPQQPASSLQSQPLLLTDGTASKPAPAPSGQLVRVAPQHEAQKPSTALTTIPPPVNSGPLDLYHRTPKPDWHAPWKLMRVISGHLGWVRSLAVDPSNAWFASGAGDRVIKVRDC